MFDWYKFKLEAVLLALQYCFMPRHIQKPFDFSNDFSKFANFLLGRITPFCNAHTVILVLDAFLQLDTVFKSRKRDTVNT